MTGRTVVVTAVIAMITGYGGWGVPPAFAASLAGSSFEIEADANTAVDGGAGSIDWGNAAGADIKHDVPSGGGDDSFTGGTHEDSLVPKVASGSIPPNKSDLKDFGLYVEKTASKVFLNVFWSRVQDPSGTTNMDFEFNQSAVTKNDPVGSPQIIPVRTVGDLLLTYDLTNGGSVATMSKRFWTAGNDWGPATVLSATEAIATINATTVPAAAGLGPFSPRTFGEASVDLAAIIPTAGGCKTYGSVYLKSRSSASFNSELKDFIAPQSVTVSNCGAVKVHKTDANGPLAGASFTLYKNAAPLAAPRGPEDSVSAGTCGPTDAAGNCAIEDVQKGDYWLVETTVPAGHDGVADQAVSITAGDQVVQLNLVDPIQTGTLVVVKDAQPNNAQDFGFTVGSTAFSLDDDADATLPSSQSFTLPVGNHTVTEGTAAGWSLQGISCVGGTSQVSLGTRSATATLTKNGTITCTFTNVVNSKDVGLTTTASVTRAGGSWNDSASLTGDGVNPVTGTVTFYACAPAAAATACSSGGTQVGTPVAVSQVAGSSYGASTSTSYTPPGAGWTCFRAEFVSSSPFYQDDTHTNATTECFLAQNDDLTVTKTATPSFSRAVSWSIGKSVDASSVRIAEGGTATSTYTVSVSHGASDSGWVVTGSITVANPNGVAFTGVSVQDAIDNGGTCVVTGGASVTVPAKGSVSLPYSCSYASAPADPSGTNTATATWDAATYFTANSSATGTAAADFATVSPATSNASVSVVDSLVGSLGTVTSSDPSPKTFTYVITRSGVAGQCTQYPNTASFSSTGGASGSASANVDLCVGSNLTASMTAAGSYDRTDLWSISKVADKSAVALEEGETSATFTYTVTASPDGSQETGQVVDGTVTVANPNAWENVTADVTVATNLGGSCTVAGGDDAVIPAGGSRDLGFTCSFDSPPAHTGTVVASIAWDGAAASTPGSAAAAATPVTLTLGEETDSTVTVTDDKTDPSSPVVLGTADWADGPTSFTYDLTKAAPAACTTYTNTAVLEPTGDSAQADVEVCPFTGGGGGVIVPTLPHTGDSTGLLLRIGLSLLALGGALLLISRRRRSAAS